MVGSVKLALKGMAMGIAEVIPGVSGGTIAFITGIYERLIDAIKSVDVKFFKLLFALDIKGAWRHVDGGFLFVLALGMGVGLIGGVFGVSHLMAEYPEELWGFFFGLILASALYIGRQVKQWQGVSVALVLVGVVLAYGITIISPVEGSTNLGYVFVCGVIAISALILPGISGSFMLLLLGMYSVVIPTVKHFLTTFDPGDLLLIGTFAIGCIVGLATFSRVLSWLFHSYHDQTLAFLTGVMLGSLNKIWPWRIPTKWMQDDGTIIQTEIVGADLKILAEANVLPKAYYIAEPNTLIVVLCAIAGFAIVFAFDKLLGED